VLKDHAERLAVLLEHSAHLPRVPQHRGCYRPAHSGARLPACLPHWCVTVLLVRGARGCWRVRQGWVGQGREASGYTGGQCLRGADKDTKTIRPGGSTPGRQLTTHRWLVQRRAELCGGRRVGFEHESDQQRLEAANRSIVPTQALMLVEVCGGACSSVPISDVLRCRCQCYQQSWR
jgi:hypothetical protein